MQVNLPYIGIMLCAPVAAYGASRLGRSAPSPLQLTPMQRLGIALGAFCGSMVLAKIPYLLMDPEGLRTGHAWLENGKTITFGLVGGYLGVEYAKYSLGIRQKTGDAFAVPAAVAIAIGRIACFVGGCCYGTPTNLPWAVRFGDGIPRHPTQLFESAFHVGMAVLLYQLRQREIFRGNLIKFYFLSYFAYRFVTEYIRPEPRLLLNLTLYQWSALVFAPLFAALWWRDAHISRSTTGLARKNIIIP